MVSGSWAVWFFSLPNRSAFEGTTTVGKSSEEPSVDSDSPRDDKDSSLSTPGSCATLKASNIRLTVTLSTQLKHGQYYRLAPAHLYVRDVLSSIGFRPNAVQAGNQDDRARNASRRG